MEKKEMQEMATEDMYNDLLNEIGKTMRQTLSSEHTVTFQNEALAKTIQARLQSKGWTVRYSIYFGHVLNISLWD